MNLLVEISLYPLKDEYIPAIQAFIERLNSNDKLKVQTNTVSTQVFGEHDALMNTLRDEMRISYEQFGRCVFVCKFLGGDLNPQL